MVKVPMTPEGYKKLQERLKHLKAVERPISIRDIEEARGHGDLSENAEYDAAKERQAHLNNEIQQVEHKLASAQVIDPSKIDEKKVVFGATVTLTDLNTDNTVTYQIVGVDESDIKNGKISIESPIARSIIGKEQGDEVKVSTPKGIKEFVIEEISFS